MHKRTIVLISLGVFFSMSCSSSRNEVGLSRTDLAKQLQRQTVFLWDSINNESLWNEPTFLAGLEKRCKNDTDFIVSLESSGTVTRGDPMLFKKWVETAGQVHVYSSEVISQLTVERKEGANATKKEKGPTVRQKLLQLNAMTSELE